MKLEELFESTFMKDVDIDRWLGRYVDGDIPEWTRTSAGIVFEGTLYFTEQNNIEKIPFKIAEIKNGGLYMKRSYDLSDTINMPNSVSGDLNIQNTSIGSMNGLPKKIGGFLFMDDCNIISFKNTQDQLSQMYIGERIWHTWEDVKEGGLGLLLISGLKGITTAQSRLPKPFEIINSYMNKKDDIFECQAELIDNGFDEFAKL